MFARLVLLGVMALATLSSVRVRQEQRISVRFLLRVGRVSEDVGGLRVFERDTYGVPESFHVDVDGVPTPTNRLPLSGMTIQVWLLRADGTSLTQRDKPSRMSAANPWEHSDTIEFAFVPTPPEELAGVVVSVNGTLYVREIKAS
jgi:hypothetical protein